MKILIIGLGGIGQRHLRNLRLLRGDGLEIIGCDPRQDPPVLTDQLKVEEGAHLADKYNVPIHADLELALACAPDVAFICNPTSMHLNAAMQAAQAGCHLFIEKPLSHSLEHIEALIDLVETRHLHAVVGYQMRFHPCLKHLAELVKARRVGKIISVHAEVGEYMPGWHTYEDYRQMYASRQDLGGGVILSQIHEFDYLYWLFGLPESVYTRGGHLSSLEIDVEDSADSLMQCFVDGQPVPVLLHQDYLQRPLSRFCEVYGEAGKIRMDLRTLNVVVLDGMGNKVESISFDEYPRNQLFIDELSAFLDTMAGKNPPLVDLRQGVQSLRMALAARESLATGKVVELER